jgi:hypothetical protein
MERNDPKSASGSLDRDEPGKANSMDAWCLPFHTSDFRERATISKEEKGVKPC